MEKPLVLCYKNDPTRTRLLQQTKAAGVIERGRIKAKPLQPFCFYNQGTLPGGLDGDQRYLLPDKSRKEGIPVPKPLEHGRSLIVSHKVKYFKANQGKIRSSNKTSDLTLYISAYTHKC